MVKPAVDQRLAAFVKGTERRLRNHRSRITLPAYPAFVIPLFWTLVLVHLLDHLLAKLSPKDGADERRGRLT